MGDTLSSRSNTSEGSKEDQVITKEEITLLYLRDPKEVERLIYRNIILPEDRHFKILCELGDPKILHTFLEKYIHSYPTLPENFIEDVKCIFFKDPKRTYWLVYLGYIDFEDPKALEVICKDSRIAYLYARNIAGPSDKTREAACRSSRLAYEYASEIDKCPRDDTRKAACRDPEHAYLYARDVDEVPRSDTRKAVCKDPRHACRYLEYVDKRQHPDTWKSVQDDEYFKEQYVKIRLNFFNHVHHRGVYY